MALTAHEEMALVEIECATRLQEIAMGWITARAAEYQAEGLSYDEAMRLAGARWRELKRCLMADT